MKAVAFATERWLALTNLCVAVFLALPFAAPWLMSSGQSEIAGWIYRLYSATCHQWPFRAYFLFGPQLTYSFDELSAVAAGAVYSFVGSPDVGYKVAFCTRNVAIYLGVWLAGLVYAAAPSRFHALPLRSYALLITPMAIDGLTQLVGLRESNLELRTLTGLLFGVASVWLVYPRVARLLESTLSVQPRSWLQRV